MHYRFIRDSFAGRVIYHASKHKYFAHKEEQLGYVPDEKYLDSSSASISKESNSSNTDSEYIIVDWDGDDDPENPFNWPMYQKVFFVAELMFLTVSVYMASAIYTPGAEEIMQDLNVGRVVSLLPLTLFVIGYAVGPMVLSPMSENAIFGRTSIYIVTLFLFVILQIPTALVGNIAGLCVLRFLAGFFASPALATGGASIGDVITMPWMPVGIAAWSVGAVCGPSIGPLIGSVFTHVFDWRWTFWIMLIISGTCLILLTFFLPETYSHTLLTRKAKRLRKVTGNERIVSAGELTNKSLTARELAIDTLWRPIEITIKEPVVLLIDVYIALVYAIMYLWFEAFPIVFLEVHHFTLIEMGVCYVGIIIGVLTAAGFYIPIIYSRFTKVLLGGNMVNPEVFIPPAIVGSVMMPIGIFIFGWTSAADIHWIGPVIGSAVFAFGAFVIFQTLFNYLGMSFYRFLASVFASNDLFRSAVAGAFPLFGAPLFSNLATPRFPVAWGSSVLGFISVAMILIPVFFQLNGPKLRASSKYAGDGL